MRLGSALLRPRIDNEDELTQWSLEPKDSMLCDTYETWGWRQRLTFERSL